MAQKGLLKKMRNFIRFLHVLISLLKTFTVSHTIARDRTVLNIIAASRVYIMPPWLREDNDV